MHQEHKELLQELYETYQKALRLAALSKKVPECEVNDIVQDTFMAFMDKYEAKFPVWNIAQQKAMLMRILENRCNDYFRSLKRHEEISIEANELALTAELLQSQGIKDVSSDLIEREKLEQIRKAILNMSPALKEVAILHMVEGRPRDEVCKILGINDSTCRMRISRIRRQIAKLLKERD